MVARHDDHPSILPSASITKLDGEIAWYQASPIIFILAGVLMDTSRAASVAVPTCVDSATGAIEDAATGRDCGSTCSRVRAASTASVAGVLITAPKTMSAAVPAFARAIDAVTVSVCSSSFFGLPASARPGELGEAATCTALVRMDAFFGDANSSAGTMVEHDECNVGSAK